MNNKYVWNMKMVGDEQGKFKMEIETLPARWQVQLIINNNNFTTFIA